jgi:hypothetical protein
MNLQEYFETATGVGVLATADSSGKVDAALYARPHVIDDETVAFIMVDRRTHKNLDSNPHAVYLFKEQEGYKGTRLYLTKTREEKDPELIESYRRRKHGLTSVQNENQSKYLVYFHIDETRPLTGNNKGVVQKNDQERES